VIPLEKQTKVAFYKAFPIFNTLSEEEREETIQAYRKMKVKDLSQNEWFWFHPTGFALFHFGVTTIPTVLMSISGTIALIFKSYYLMVFMYLFATVMGWALYKKIKSWEHIKGTTMYEFFIDRDRWIKGVE